MNYLQNFFVDPDNAKYSQKVLNINQPQMNHLIKGVSKLIYSSQNPTIFLTDFHFYTVLKFLDAIDELISTRCRSILGSLLRKV